MAEEQLDIKIKAVLAQASNEFDRLTNAATNFDKTMVNVIDKVDLMKNTITRTATSVDGLSKTVTVFDSNGKALKKTFVDLSNAGKKTKSSLSGLFDLNRLYLYWNLTKRLRDNFKKIITSAVEFNETQNKFNVSMGSAEKEATRFVNKITEAVGIGKAELMDYQSTYKNILSGLATFSDKQSEKISESLVKMALDYSSLFNVDRSSAMNKFQAALTGSIRPIRSDSGFDVSEQTIGEKAKAIGLERTVGQLTQMEKRILRIIVLMDQMKNTGAMNDLARTIEEPANQIKVLQDQIKELGVWIGNVFMGTIGRVLPYINAFVMVLKEIIKTLAIFVGYEATSNGLKDVFEVAEDSANGIAAGVGSANKQAKELKKTLMGFDVLNVITTPKESDSSGGVGSVDPKILEALEEYDSLMENVSMKATQIRDRIMEWLGFTKIINPETGEISWKLGDGYTNLEKIRDIILLIISFGITKKIIEIVKAIGKLTKFFGPLKSLFKTIQGLGLTGVGAKIATVATAVAGITTAVLGVFTAIKGIIDLFQGDKFDGIMKIIIGLATTVAGIALTIGAFPVAIGAAIVAGIGLIVKAIGDNWDKISEFFTNVWNKFNETIIQPIIDFVKSIADTVWNSALVQIIVGVVKASASIIDKVIEIGIKIGEIFAALGKATNEYIIKPFITFFTDLATFVWTKAIQPIINFFIKAWNTINEKFIQPIINAFKTIGTKIADFIGNAIKAVINGVLYLIEERINGFIRMLNGAVDIINKIPNVNISRVDELQIPRLATGGLPDVGELFVAREAGPELVGKIGNSNAVMNNQQIVQAVSQGVAQAVASVMGSNRGDRPIVIELNGREIAYATREGQGRISNIFGS